MHWAAKGNAVDVMKYLLRKGGNPRALDDNGSSPLHLACYEGHVEVTLVLIDATDMKTLHIRDYDVGYIDTIHCELLPK